MLQCVFSDDTFGPGIQEQIRSQTLEFSTYVLYESFGSDMQRGGWYVDVMQDQVAWGTHQPTAPIFFLLHRFLKILRDRSANLLHRERKISALSYENSRTKANTLQYIRDDGNMVVYSAVVCGRGQGDSGMVIVLLHKGRPSVAWLFVLLCIGCG